MALIIDRGWIGGDRVERGIEPIFRLRGSYPVPEVFPDPPDDWKGRFERLAEECDLHLSFEEAVELVREFLKLESH